MSKSGAQKPDQRRRSVTVVIPTYNRADLLAKTLATVFEQELPPAEVVVVDDGSSDGTAEYLDTVEVSRVLNPAGGWGPGRARNEGFKRVRTDLVAFLDSDDLLLPSALSKLESALAAAATAPFAFGRSLTAIEDNGWLPTGLMSADDAEMVDPLRSLFARNFVPSVGTLARVDAVQAIGGYPTAAFWSEDHYLWLRLAQLGDPAFVPSITSVYRVHAGNRHSAVRAGGDVGDYLALAREDSRLAPAIPARLGVSLCNSLTAALRSGDLRAAAKTIRTGLIGRDGKLEIVKQALRHWRARRRWSAAGVQAWEEDDRAPRLACPALTRTPP